MSEREEAKVWYKGKFVSLAEIEREKRIEFLNDTDLKILRTLLAEG